MQWEYLQVKTYLSGPILSNNQDTDELNEQGEDGWELVSVTPITDFQGKTGLLLYTFKRPL